MTPKFSKSDAYRTANKIVGICNIDRIQFLLMGVPQDGWYEGRNYWNCFDIYDVNGIRFHIGNGATETNNYSSTLLTKLGNEAQKLSGWDDATKKKRAELLKEFTDSIEKGIHDPSPVTSFANFKRQLVEQKDMWPNKDIREVAKELFDEIPYSWTDEAKTELNTKINNGVEKIINKYELRNVCKSTDDIFVKALEFMCKDEKERQQKKEEVIGR